MKKLLFILINCIALSQSVLAINYSSYIDYLSKTIEATDSLGQEFSAINLENQPDIQSWLKEIDMKLNSQELGNYDSELLISFAEDGYINKISIAKLNEDDIEKFKTFISKLNNTRFAKPPESIAANTVFKLDTGMLYLERNPDYLKRQDQVELKSTRKIDFEQNINLLSKASQIEAQLIKPNYIDYPSIGDILTLRVNDNLIVNAKIIEQNSKSITVLIKQIDDKLVDLLFVINKPQKDFHSTNSMILASSLGAATSAGIAVSISSYGIVPGTMALVSGIGTAIKEINDQVSFNLSQGDKLRLLALDSI